jgi:hypothetical protein
MDQYPEMIYGWCLLCIIHFIVTLREQHPGQQIFITKYDYSDTYRRITHAATAAAQSIVLFAGIAFLVLQLTFGGSPSPPTWCMFSKMVTDLANELLLCPGPSDSRHASLRAGPQPLSYNGIILNNFLYREC